VSISMPSFGIWRQLSAAAPTTASAVPSDSLACSLPCFFCGGFLQFFLMCPLSPQLKHDRFSSTRGSSLACAQEPLAHDLCCEEPWYSSSAYEMIDELLPCRTLPRAASSAGNDHPATNLITSLTCLDSLGSNCLAEHRSDHSLGGNRTH
jgi:hypothetical protein